MISKSMSNFKKETSLANLFYSHNFYYDKSIWRLLLRQYIKENGSYPIEYDETDIATTKSLNEFEETMWAFADRIIPTHEVLSMKDDKDCIPMSYKTGFVETQIWLRKIK